MTESEQIVVRIPTRQEFVDAYVRIQVRNHGQKDTPELREKAERVYDSVVIPAKLHI